jgi:hypothetical protein
VANIRARASMIDGEVEWKKRGGGGTVFVLHKRGAGEVASSMGHGSAV